MSRLLTHREYTDGRERATILVEHTLTRGEVASVLAYAYDREQGFSDALPLPAVLDYMRRSLRVAGVGAVLTAGGSDAASAWARRQVDRLWPVGTFSDAEGTT